ncbi:Reticulon-4-interacting protein 1, mitochondrial [Eumeta japonica]|uniref:Reticulon-4-interacting protein 1, mitochondrial n=1 Tax=Eumeta variegata TaxID=151549 RepID=A0A4C1XP45_EUMVA|nr:Reticulon-4-interacting protein 1, mitochondrial [Eumeta japonica]
MDELKARAGEKFEALHVAAKTVAGNGRTKVENIYHQTAEAIKKIQEILQDIWQNEFIIEGRERVGAWTRDTVKRIKEGAPPLSPILLYEELVALFKDRVWRRSVIIFSTGVALGGLAGLLLGLRAARRPPAGPHCRALHSLPDGSVILLEDAVAPALCSGEVLIRVQAFSVCGADRAALRGRGALLRALLGKSNVTVGRGFSGVVLDVGYGVTDLELGDEVWGCVSEWHGGAASELLAIRSIQSFIQYASKPPPTQFGSGCRSDAAVGGRSGARCVELVETHRTQLQRVAIAGAASGEGCYLVQLLSNAMFASDFTYRTNFLDKPTVLYLGQ